jgi:hypothetical protein
MQSTDGWDIWKTTRELDMVVQTYIRVVARDESSMSLLHTCVVALQ